MTKFEFICLQNTVHIIGPQIRQAKHIVRHHFKHRHDGRGSKCVKSWIHNLREIDRASGYSDALFQVNQYLQEH